MPWPGPDAMSAEGCKEAESENAALWSTSE